QPQPPLSAPGPLLASDGDALLSSSGCRPLLPFPSPRPYRFAAGSMQLRDVRGWFARTPGCSGEAAGPPTKVLSSLRGLPEEAGSSSCSRHFLPQPSPLPQTPLIGLKATRSPVIYWRSTRGSR
ncbi:unnamed protein product, partial [Urochloa humidicola]